MKLFISVVLQNEDGDAQDDAGADDVDAVPQLPGFS